jgi:molybdenum cofactor biosynthesis enzyme MoaA
MKSYIRIMLTDSCNLACSYCFNENYEKGNQFIDLDVLKKLLEKSGITKFDKVVLTGGEPLLSSSFKEISTYAKDYAKVLSLTTNGSLITSNYEKLASLLKEEIIDSVSISLDRMIPEEFRLGTKTQSDLFFKVMDGIALLSKEFGEKIAINTVVSSRSIDDALENIFILSSLYKIKMYHLQPLINDPIIKSGKAYEVRKEAMNASEVFYRLLCQLERRNIKYKTAFSNSDLKFEIHLPSDEITIKVVEQIDNLPLSLRGDGRKIWGWFTITPDGKIITPELEIKKPENNWYRTYYDEW